MPKKIQTNPKAADARERKDAVKKDKQEKDKKAKEDALWVVNFYICIVLVVTMNRKPINTYCKKRTARSR
jgi:hypothetical protein